MHIFSYQSNFTPNVSIYRISMYLGSIRSTFLNIGTIYPITFIQDVVMPTVVYLDLPLD